MTDLGANAFWGCANLAAVDLGDGLGSIGASAFQGCGSLVSVAIPGNVATLGDFAFYGCGVLESVRLDEGLATIGQGCFQACPGLEHVTVPASVTSIGPFAFALGGNLRGLYFPGGPPAAGPSILQGNAAAVVYHAPGVGAWSDPWHGWPTAPWDPEVVTTGWSAGVFGIDIRGSADFAVRVEMSDDLSTGSWIRGGVIPLTSGSANFSDAESAARAARFYRFRMP